MIFVYEGHGTGGEGSSVQLSDLLMNTTTTSWPPPSPSPLPPAPPVDRRARPIAAIVLVTAVALAFADVSIVALAIPDLYIEFGSTIPAVSWVLTGYALAVAVSGVAWLVLLRRVSGATLALAGAAVFAASSLAAGFAPSLATLIAARVAQGVGGAALVAGSLGVLVTLLGDSRRAARWWAAAGVAGAALGPVLGGAVTQLLDWRAVFIIQAPIALMAAAATVRGAPPSDQHRGRRAPRAHRRPRGAMVADTALAFTFGALVGVLFLGVLLLVVVWGLPPIAGALVVSALPIGTLLGPRLAAAMSDRGAAVAGSAMLAGGLLTLAHLPSIQPAGVAAALALCGLGFGAIVNALNRHVLPPGSGARAATLTSTARHFGLVLGLAIIAPVLAAQVTAAAEAAPVSATKAMLDAPIDAPTKVRIALDIRDLLDDAADGEVPDLRGAFDRNGAGDNAAIAQLHDDIELGVQEELTRSFRDSFTIAAGFALIAGVVALGAMALSSGARSSASGTVLGRRDAAPSVGHRHRRRHARRRGGAAGRGGPHRHGRVRCPPGRRPVHGTARPVPGRWLRRRHATLRPLRPQRCGVRAGDQPRGARPVARAAERCRRGMGPRHHRPGVEGRRQPRRARRRRARHVARVGGGPTAVDHRPRTAVLVPRPARGGVMRVLVVEDEPDLASAIAISLRREGYAVDVAGDGASALDRVGMNEYDLVCLDLNLPDTDGLEVCRQVVSMPTADDAVVPRIIMLTARGGIDDRISGLDQGADDYLVKPFSLSELGARVRAVLRRDTATTSSVVRRAGIELDSSRHEVRVNGTRVELTTKEFALLRWFVLHPDVVHSSERLLEHVWDEHADPFTNTVRVTISNLRRKLAAGAGGVAVVVV